MNIIIEKNKPKRYEFIDILRGLSVLWMIEAHITDVVLWPAAKSTFLFYLIDKSNGFVATTFLFCAGAGFYISTSRKFDDFKNFRKPLWIYLRKLAFILFIAFSMHLPTRDFFQLFSLTNDQLVRFVECDILQTIVYSSLIALVLFFIIPNLKYLKFVSIVIALVAYYATSFVWAINPFNYLPTFFATMFAEWPVSHFPMFPWMGHFFVGIALTSLFMESMDKKRFVLKLGVYSLITSISMLIVKDLPYFNYPYADDWWHTSPSHFIFRISVVSFLFSFLYYFEDFIANKFFAKPLILMGRESLLLYVGNVILIYGSIINDGIRQYLPSQVDSYSTFLIFTGLTFILYYISKGWHFIKTDKPMLSKIVIYGLSAYFLIWLIF